MNVVYGEIIILLYFLCKTKIMKRANERNNFLSTILFIDLLLFPCVFSSFFGGGGGGGSESCIYCLMYYKIDWDNIIKLNYFQL